MSSRWHERVAGTFGARIAFWYFALFAAGALLVLLLAGWMLQASLARRDQDAVIASLVRYTDAYSQGGVAVLDSLIAADRAAASYEPLLVRVVAGGRVRMLSMPIEWSRFDLGELDVPPIGRSTFQRIADGGGERLDVASAMLIDGTLFQIGRSSTRREAMLDRYRDTSLLVVAAVVCVGLLGGLTLTGRALQPLQELTNTILRILQTGRTSERVPVAGSGDQLDTLGTLVNRMLDRIDGLVQGMRTTLDHVAHDLRTPLTRLRGTAEVALQSARTSDEYREALADCLEEAERVGRILDALMDVAEAETGAMQLRRETLPLDALVREAVELYEGVADDKGIDLQVHIPDGDWTFAGDRVRLTQVFANLVDNAVKYTAGPGRVTVTVRGDDRTIDVVVADTGPGISAADLPRIWERLYRGDQSRSQRGLGLGLSLVRAIVEAHGGTAGVESEPGQGARFRVVLPRRV